MTAENTLKYDWQFQEKAGSRSVVAGDGSGPSIITRIFLMKDVTDPVQSVGGQEKRARAEDAIRALSEAPGTGHVAGDKPWQLEYRINGNIPNWGAYDPYGFTGAEFWDDRCTDYNGPGPVITNIDAVQVAAPHTFEVTVRAELYWPVQDSYSDSCYIGQYRRATTSSSTRAIKLYRVRDIVLTGDTIALAEEWNPTGTPTPDPAINTITGPGFSYEQWVPTQDVGGVTVDGQADG